MRLPLIIAWRYIFSKKSVNAINIITLVSMLGIMVGTAALILVLSVFNGFEDLVVKLYNSFYPEINVTLVEGKTFEPDAKKLQQIQNIKGIAAVSKVLEENALLAYNREEHIATIKGVDENYKSVTQVSDSIFVGDFVLQSGSRSGAVVGAGIWLRLSIRIVNIDSLSLEDRGIDVFMPKTGTKSSFNPRQAFNQGRIYPTGAFRIQQDFDNQFLFTPLAFIQKLLGTENKISALEIRAKDGEDTHRIISEIEQIMGPMFIVKNRYQQNEFLYKVMRTEKLAVYLILSFILVIAAFNMIGSISMIVIDKRPDIGILKAMGATGGFVKKTFLAEGIIQTLLSAGAGFLIATTLCLLQIYFQVIPMPGEGTFVVQAFPVKMQAMDFVLVFFTVLLIGVAAAYFPARRAGRQKWIFKEN